MNFIAITILLFSSLVLSLRQELKHSLIVSLASTYFAFVLMYLFVSDQVAQDRFNYYVWYVDSSQLLRYGTYKDIIFTYLLNLLPDDLSPAQFGFVFSTLMFLFVTAFLAGLRWKKFISLNQMSLIMLAVVCDRLFIDMTLSATRSSMASIIFLIGIMSQMLSVRIVTWVISWGFHGSMFFFLMACYILSEVFRWSLRLKHSRVIPQVCAATGMVLMFLRYYRGSSIFPESFRFRCIAMAGGREALIRGISNVGELSKSIIIQIGLGIMVPTAIILYLFQRDKTLEGDKATTAPDELSKRLLPFAVTSTLLILILYPEFALARRLFFISILCVHCLLPIKYLRWLAPIKMIVILIVLYSSLR